MIIKYIVLFPELTHILIQHNHYITNNIPGIKHIDNIMSLVVNKLSFIKNFIILCYLYTLIGYKPNNEGKKETNTDLIRRSPTVNILVSS